MNTIESQRQAAAIHSDILTLSSNSILKFVKMTLTDYYITASEIGSSVYWSQKHDSRKMSCFLKHYRATSDACRKIIMASE